MPGNGNARDGEAAGAKGHVEADGERSTGRRGHVLAAMNAFLARERRRSLERRIKRRFDSRLSLQLDAALVREEESS